ARKYVHSLGIHSIREWLEYIKLGKKPPEIPSNPDNYYKKEWKNWGDWFGTGTVAPRDRVYRSFEHARIYVHSLALRSQSEWYKYCKSGGKPEDIPVNPSNGYTKEWKGWGDWLGTGTVAHQDKEFKTFSQA